LVTFFAAIFFVGGAINFILLFFIVVVVQMFGVIVSGRLPISNFQQASENQFMIQLADIEHAGNHLVVFMTGETPFPEGYAGAVYFNYELDGQSKWIFLGKICNQKPSCIFKITSLKHEANFAESMPFSNALAKPSHMSTAMVGISVEPESQIDALTPATEAAASSNTNSFGEFTQKMLENFYNYACSFTKDAPDGNQYVPLSTLQNWFENFKRRLSINPNFWKS